MVLKCFDAYESRNILSLLSGQLKTPRNIIDEWSYPKKLEKHLTDMAGNPEYHYPNDRSKYYCACKRLKNCGYISKKDNEYYLTPIKVFKIARSYDDEYWKIQDAVLKGDVLFPKRDLKRSARLKVVRDFMSSYKPDFKDARPAKQLEKAMKDLIYRIKSVKQPIIPCKGKKNRYAPFGI